MRYLIIVLMASALFLIGCSDSFNQEPTVSTTIGESGNP